MKSPMMARRQFLAAGAAALAAPAVAQPAKTATLRFVPQASLTLLDPILTTALVTNNHAHYVFDTLYSTAADGIPKPQMASGAEVSADGRTWKIGLREGLKFHDGAPVLARDCAASIARWAKREPIGQLLDKVVESYGSADDKTIEVKLKKPFPLFLNAIGKPDSSLPFVMPERLAQTDPAKQVTEMVGSGPYKFVAAEFVTGSRAVYEKNEAYVPRSEPPVWGTGAKVAYFPRIEWHIVPDPATASAALQNGEVDWWEQPLADLLPALAKDRNITLAIDSPQGRYSLIRFNTLQPPFNDVRLRRAVRLGVKQEDYMRATFGNDTSLWRTCQSMFPCGTQYETDQPDAMPGDYEAARKALKEAGYAGQKTVIINPTDFPAIHPLGLVATDLLKQIGMNVDLQEIDWGTLVQRRANREPVEKGGWSLFCTFGPSLGYSNPATSGIIRGQGLAGWYGWWESAKAEQLVQEWLDAPDAARQKAVAIELSRFAMDELPYIGLGQWFGKTAYRKSITGVLQGLAPYPWNVRPA
ncbi:peptide/nickel transport system substrate-binding protein [Rhizobiales bacterium GAS191]|nr:peptide/nickel transport system substrate-binding protein [Rhizobiales bacterium GAS113]SED56608.1 peptide/nickel transport system substrate-binding protein [Rhizobiales bacterium GAS191]